VTFPVQKEIINIGPKCEDNTTPDCKCSNGDIINNFNPTTKKPLCRDGTFPRYRCATGKKFSTSCQDGNLPKCSGGVPQMCKDGSEPNLYVYPHCLGSYFEQRPECPGGFDLLTRCADGRRPSTLDLYESYFKYCYLTE